MKKILFAAALLISSASFAGDYYSRDMINILKSQQVKEFLAKRNLTLMSLSYQNSGLCPTNSHCSTFYLIVAPNEQARKCQIYVSVTDDQVKVETRDSSLACN